MGVEVLAGKLLLIQEEGQVHLLAIHPHARKHFPGPRQADGAYPVGRVIGLIEIVLLDTGVCEIRGGVEMWKHSALNTRVHDEEVIRGDIQRGPLLHQ